MPTPDPSASYSAFETAVFGMAARTEVLAVGLGTVVLLVGIATVFLLAIAAINVYRP